MPDFSPFDMNFDGDVHAMLSTYVNVTHVNTKRKSARSQPGNGGHCEDIHTCRFR